MSNESLQCIRHSSKCILYIETSQKLWYSGYCLHLMKAPRNMWLLPNIFLVISICFITQYCLHPWQWIGTKKKKNLESVHLLDASKNCWKKRTKFLLKIGGILIPRDSFILLLLSASYTLRFWKRLTSRLQRQPTLLVTETILKKPGTVYRCQPGQTHAMDWWLYPNALSISSSPTSFTDTTLQMLILPS